MKALLLPEKKVARKIQSLLEMEDSTLLENVQNIALIRVKHPAQITLLQQLLYRPLK